MAEGKTNPVFYRLYLDGIDLSGDARTFNEAGGEWDEHEQSGWSDGVKNYSLGKPSVVLSGFKSVLNTTANTGSYTELVNREEYVTSLYLGIRAAPAVGDPCFCAVMDQKKYKVNGEGPLETEIDLIRGQGNTAPTKWWGKVLFPLTSIEASTDGTAVDLGAANTNGCLAYLHVTATSSGNFAFTIEHSETGSFGGEEATLLTFDSNGSAVVGEQDSAASMYQYVRFVATRTAGTISVTCALVPL